MKEIQIVHLFFVFVFQDPLRRSLHRRRNPAQKRRHLAGKDFVIRTWEKAKFEIVFTISYELTIRFSIKSVWIRNINAPRLKSRERPLDVFLAVSMVLKFFKVQCSTPLSCRNFITGIFNFREMVLLCAPLTASPW